MTDQEIYNVKDLINNKLKPYEANILKSTSIDIGHALRSANVAEENNTTAYELMGYRRGFIDCLYWSGRIQHWECLLLKDYYNLISQHRKDGILDD